MKNLENLLTKHAMICVHYTCFHAANDAVLQVMWCQRVETGTKIKYNQRLISLLLHLQIHEGVWVQTHRNMSHR